MQLVQANDLLTSSEIDDLTFRAHNANRQLMAKCGSNFSHLQVQVVKMSEERGITYHLVLHTDGGRAQGVMTHATLGELTTALGAYAALSVIW